MIEPTWAEQNMKLRADRDRMDAVKRREQVARDRVEPTNRRAGVDVAPLLRPRAR